MLGNAPYYLGLTRRYTILFGALFDNLYIERTDPADPSKNQQIKVPISYAPKDKLLLRPDADPNIQRAYEESLPRMAFELMDISYDGSRKQPTNNYFQFFNAANTPVKQYVPVPYNFEFQLSIAVRVVEDGTKIIEQILPFFTPDYTPSIELIPEYTGTWDIPIILQSVKYENIYQGSFDQRQSIIWTLSFKIKGWLFGSSYKPGVIKFFKGNFYLPNVDDGQLATAVGVTKVAEELDVQVTLTSNNLPTSNVAASIPYMQINENNDYGFGQVITNYEG